MKGSGILIATYVFTKEVSEYRGMWGRVVLHCLTEFSDEADAFT